MISEFDGDSRLLGLVLVLVYRSNVLQCLDLVVRVRGGSNDLLWDA